MSTHRIPQRILVGWIFVAFVVGIGMLSSETARAQSPVSEVKDSNDNTLMTIFDNGELEVSGGVLLPDGTLLDESGDVGGLSLPFSGSASVSAPVLDLSNTGSGDAIQIGAAGEDGIQIENAIYGLYVLSPTEDGLLVSGAGENGLDVEDSGGPGIQVTGSGIAAQLSGDSTSVLEIRNQDGNDGIQILEANDDGMQVENASYGVYANGVSNDGLIVRGAGDDGVDVEGADHGIIAEGDTDADGEGYAGRFLGDVDVSGTLNANAKNFKIDHPQDPTGKYLKHSSMESRNRLNVYTGNVTLDGTGEATVELPDYVEAVNRNYRYQLTAIGAAAPRLHIAAEIDNNSFRIAGGEAGMKVSWRVTGIRDDAWAREHPFQNVVQKPAAEQGTYRNPRAHGAPMSEGGARKTQDQKSSSEASSSQEGTTDNEKEGEKQDR